MYKIGVGPGENAPGMRQTGVRNPTIATGTPLPIISFFAISFQKVLFICFHALWNKWDWIYDASMFFIQNGRVAEYERKAFFLR